MPWKQMDVLKQRREFVLRSVGGEKFVDLCREYEVSRKTGYKWVKRFIEQGQGGLTDESRRPHHHAKELAEEVVCEIVRLKKLKPTWGPKKVRAVYARKHEEVPSESSFKRVLERAGWVERRRVRRRESAGGLSMGRKAEKPNDIWTVDFKGWWYGGDGRRVEPLTVRDEFSRYVLELRRVPDAGTATVRDCFEKLFKEYGLPGAIRSDNGPPFGSKSSVLGLTRLSAWWLVLGIDLERGRPGCPQDNSAHERLHLDVAKELEGQPGADQQAILDQWRWEFDHERPHEALQMRCPAEFYRKSERPYTSTPAQIDYGLMAQRKVHVTGTIQWNDQSIRISQALAGWSVGLEPAEPGKWKVWFGRLLIGTLEEAGRVFAPTGGSS
jgi:transposase InsO family protein